MQQPHRSFRWSRAVAAVASAAVGLALSACSHSTGGAVAPNAGSGTGRPAVAVPIPGTDEKKVILTADAARRVGIETAAVRQVPAAGGGVQDVIPISAVYYDGSGGTWVYTSPAPLQYVRASVVLGPITGGTALLDKGPAAGTVIVTVGEAELYGVEYGVGGEQ